MSFTKLAVRSVAHLAVAHLAMVCLLLACAVPVSAQGVTMLNPLKPSYSLLGFVYEPPKTEGWRELGVDPDAVRLVYAEQLAEEQINTRADFTAQSFPINTTEKVQLPDGATLARLSIAQRIKEKKDQGVELVAFSQPQQLAGDLPVFEYTLVGKVGGEDIFEDYFIALAPDKSEYLAAKLTTKDKEFRDLPYFKSLQDSITSLKFPTGASNERAEQAPEPPAAKADDPQKSTDTAAPAAPSSN